MSTTSTLITLGLIGVGGYLFIKEVWPMLKDQLEDLDLGFGGGGGGPPPGYYDDEPRMPERGIGPIIEDRFPDYVIEDRYPDYVIEDRYPDYYPIYTPPTYPIYTPPLCPPGKYWDGDRCRTIRIECPSGFEEDDGKCKPKDCHHDEYWDGRRCRDIPKLPRCGKGEYYDGKKCRDIKGNRHEEYVRIPRKLNNSRDRWHLDRDNEEKVKEIVTGKPPEPGPETKRVQDVIEKATQSFLEVYYA